MQTLIVKIDTANHAAQVANFLKTVPYIKSVIAEPRKTSALASPKRFTKASPLTAADWVRPGRPATDEEIEQMLDECEKGPSYTSKEVMDFVKTELKEWRKKKK